MTQEDLKQKLILGAARRLFFERGYDTTSMDEVARKAGVSKATVYAHFESKDNLLLQLIAEEVSALPTKACDTPIETVDDLRLALQDLAGRFAVMFQDPETVSLHRLVISQAYLFENIGKVFYEAGPLRMERQVAALLRKSVEKGILEIDDLDLAASQLLSLVVGTLPLRAMLSSKPPALQNWAKSMESGLSIFISAYIAHA
ncbi:transcriptional regulator, TetR family [Ensifer adhaerens]|nr:transcriptional regulator, TetR family [Ensifer adhaerens]